MADMFTQEVLSRQYKFLTAQLDQLCDQYDSWKVRHDRAAQQHQKVFQYSLNLRLITLKAMIQNIQNMIQKKATDIVMEVAVTGDLELLEELDIELVEWLLELYLWIMYIYYSDNLCYILKIACVLFMK